MTKLHNFVHRIKSWNHLSDFSLVIGVKGLIKGLDAIWFGTIISKPKCSVTGCGIDDQNKCIRLCARDVQCMKPPNFMTDVGL